MFQKGRPTRTTTGVSCGLATKVDGANVFVPNDPYEVCNQDQVRRLTVKPVLGWMG